MIYIGTSGFSYEDWVGPYYPTDLPKRDWLAFYAREFTALELNSSYYGVPTPWRMAQMAAKTPAGYLFAVKAHQNMTHKREHNEQVFASFVLALAPLRQAGKLGCILAQSPFSFHANQANRDYLRVFRQRLHGLPLVVEFRNREWLSAGTFELLRELGVGFCCVDEPRLPGLIPPIAEATSEIAYVRFHGRNSAKWWQHAQAYERYDYTYPPAELEEWVPKIRALAAKTSSVFLFANNHYQGQAVATARQLKMLLEEPD